jgi:hypothetical protein
MDLKMNNSNPGSNSRFYFWQKWMVVLSAIGILFGLVMAFGSTSNIFQSYNHFVAQAFWGQTQLHKAVLNYHSWIFAVLGTSIAGWSVCYLFLAIYPFRRRERWVYYCYIISLLVWAPLDSAFSIHFGIHIEAVFNFVAITFYAIPLIATYRDFFPK